MARVAGEGVELSTAVQEAPARPTSAAVKRKRLDPEMRFALVAGSIGSLPLIAILISLWVRGWSPAGDDAVIAMRSFDVFTTHTPLVGHVNQSGLYEAVFDPGPLQNWALAIPVRMFPQTAGALLGATIVEVVAVFAAIAAAVRVGGRVVGVVVAAGAVVAVWSAAVALVRPVWNPYVALIPFAAALLCAWAVSAGELMWWPAVVGFASFCVQAHLMYGPAALAIAGVSPLLGLAARRSKKEAAGWRWAVVGGGVGLVVWAPAFWQQATNSPGNLGLLFDNLFRVSRPKLGLSMGLNQLARALGPVPAWLHPPVVHESIYYLGFRGKESFAIAVFILLALLVVVAVRLGDWEVCGLGSMALLANVGAVWAVSSIPNSSLFIVSYISWITWPGAMLTWLAFAWGGYRLWVHLRSARRDSGARSPREGGRWLGAALGGVLAVAVAVSVFLGLSVERFGTTNALAWQSAGSAARQIADIAGRSGTKPSRVEVVYNGRPVNFSVASAVVYQLRVRGWHPTTAMLGGQLDSFYRPRRTDPRLTITDRGSARRPDDRELGTVSVRDPDGTPHTYDVTLSSP